jgi:hypothetical protein
MPIRPVALGQGARSAAEHAIGRAHGVPALSRDSSCAAGPPAGSQRPQAANGLDTRGHGGPLAQIAPRGDHRYPPSTNRSGQSTPARLGRAKRAAQRGHLTGHEAQLRRRNARLTTGPAACRSYAQATVASDAAESARTPVARDSATTAPESSSRTSPDGSSTSYATPQRRTSATRKSRCS